MINAILTKKIEQLKKYDMDVESLFLCEKLLEYDEVNKYIEKIKQSKLEFKISFIFSPFRYYEYVNLYRDLEKKYYRIKPYVDNHNKRLIKQYKELFIKICGQVEGKNLDDQQIDSIVENQKNQLVIAGAGSGKTTTIIGKVKYLLMANNVNPKEILLLSFTNASASEMRERVKKETNIDLDVFTFHKLGLDIIKKSLGNDVNVFDQDFYKLIYKELQKQCANPDYFKKLLYFMSTARYNERDDFDFKSESEYNKYLETNSPKTLKGEIVKSYGELEIANYLFSNGIDYYYEKPYEYDTSDENHQQYRPDFYLPEYKIYIEYYGIDKDHKVAPFFRGKNGKTASEVYNESIAWKRQLHKDNNTVLVETFYYENKNGELLDNLEKKLKKLNVLLKPKSNEKIWQIVNSNNAGIFNVVCRAFETIINLIKSNNYSLNYLYSLPGISENNLNIITLDLIKPIYEEYEKMLADNKMIDFNDMINLASSLIKDNKFIHNYKYVIVDEYQDISKSRYNLLRAMRDQNDYRLFCVGDDWQSIYRFSGSDVDLITHFGNYWGKTFISFIEKTYRFTSMMSILSGNFIMKNPNQYRKNLAAKDSSDFAIGFIHGFNDIKCIQFMTEKLNRLEKNSTVFMLGRYSFDIDLLKNNDSFRFKYNSEDKMTEIIYTKRRDLIIRFLTVHKSKGLQADYVFILNNKNYGLGFPSKISDLPIIDLLLGNGLDDYEYSEERRLFYVAITRSKKKTYLLIDENNKSCFAEELEEDYNNLMKNDTKLKKNIYTCPECGGRLLNRMGPYGPFLGCSNYPNCKYKRNY